MSGGIDRRLTEAQIHGLETWLAHVDPDVPVQMTQLVIDAVQALVEEVRERRDGEIGDVDVLQAIRRIVEAFAVGPNGAVALALIDRLLAAHGAKP